MQSQLPRQIHACWLQGERNAPELVKASLAEWKRLNPNWKITIHDRTSALRELSGFPIDLRKFHQPQAFSDILRLQLMRDGGVWVDATCFPTRPLDDWLPQRMNSGFFAFDGHPSPLDMSSWFLAAEPGHYIIEKWWVETRRYWDRPRQLKNFKNQPGGFRNNNLLDPIEALRGDKYPFYWVMYLFTQLLRTDPKFRALWDTTPTLSAEACLQAQEAAKISDLTGMKESLKTMPVQKLTWKSDNLSQMFADLFSPTA